MNTIEISTHENCFAPFGNLAIGYNYKKNAFCCITCGKEYKVLEND